MDVTDFNNNLIKKKVFLLGNYIKQKSKDEFFDAPASNSYFLHITQPSQHTSHSRSLIDNIFSNVISWDIICSNITATISNHLLQCFNSLLTFLLIHSPINLMLLTETGQKLTRKILSWITLLYISSISLNWMKKYWYNNN